MTLKGEGIGKVSHQLNFFNSSLDKQKVLFLHIFSRLEAYESKNKYFWELNITQSERGGDQKTANKCLVFFWMVPYLSLSPSLVIPIPFKSTYKSNFERVFLISHFDNEEEEGDQKDK